jgi:chitodextrinase
MPTRRPRRARALLKPATRHLSLRAAFLAATAFFVYGCGAPGEPMPPSPPIPVAITDLAGQQIGDAVQLTFSVPGKGTLGERLTQNPTLEILRGGQKPDGTPDPRSFRVVDTIPGALVANYLQKNKLHFADPISPAEIRADSGKPVVYRVRCRVTSRKVSADSNDVTLNLYPVPAPITNLAAQTTPNGVQLNWSAPTQSSGGESLANVKEYHIYRGEPDTSVPTQDSATKAAAATAQNVTPHAAWKVLLQQIATSSTPDYLDQSAQYDKTYGYVVRSVILGGPTLLESADSNAATITPKDIFPPSAPQGIVAAILPGDTAGQLVADLSWAINPEADVAGYHVYRSQQEGTRGTLVTPDLLPTPAYRDTSVQPNTRYWYTVTAVDRAGNESPASPEILVDTAQPSS